MIMFTADQVIRERQKEIFNEVQEIEHELQRLERQRESLLARKERLMMEHEILESYHNRRELSVTTTTTTTKTVRMGTPDRLTFEDTLKKIFDNTGRPMRMSEIIFELKKFGFSWSRYESAYSYIIRCPILEKVPQTRGIFQLRR